MKRILFAVFAFVVFNSASYGQFINGLSVYPANPTSNDSIYLIGSCYFQSGACNQKTLSFTLINNLIDCGAMHCLGMATFICYNNDTFSIGKLSPGNYQFKFTVNAGLGPAPCTPGIVPGPSDTLNFTVTTASGLTNPSPQEIVIGPNPCSDFIDLTFSSNEEKEISIFDMTGKICHQEIKSGNRIQLITNEIASGPYLLRIKTKSTIYQSKLFYKK